MLRQSKVGWPLLLGCWLGLACPLALADEDAPFGQPSVSVEVADDVYTLDALAPLRLTPPVRDALENGVDLHIAWRINIERQRRWWLDSQVASVVQRNRLSYHPLSRQFVVTNRNTDERRSYQRLDRALNAIGTLVDFPVVDRVLIDRPGEHRGYVRVQLVHSKLPLPLRTTAFFSSAWDLASQWREWRLD
ncbi:MAG: hypothetical protein BRD57_01270 [Proteobacteria bacterium SW_6_67_9]|nr:MAG: hypothetical protein BRD57_01270 [Proteobacteria bacterium SW_6_67_9]